VIGDPVYGGRLALPGGITPELASALKSFRRQALHACALAFEHPVTHEELHYTAPLPEDMKYLLEILENDAS
jgi:Pseudouridylate synthases, 23S RNA-specific